MDRSAQTNDHPINWAGMKTASRTMELVMKEALSTRTMLEQACFNRSDRR